MDENYAYSTNVIICPYCKDEITPDEGYYYNVYEYIKETCGSCNKEFKVEVYTETSWTTFPLDKET
jgi:uncharacterized CHY-type Zn-finger protein